MKKILCYIYYFKDGGDYEREERKEKVYFK